MQLLEVFEQEKRQPLDILSKHSSAMSDAIAQKAFPYREEPLCFILQKVNDNYELHTAFFVGTDWLIPNKLAVHVAPKQNVKAIQIDYLRMLLDSLEAPENFEHLNDLFHVEYDMPWIPIEQKQDMLSPILVIQFLKLLQRIVRKGLKKSYYRATENLKGRVKGKILVTQQIKQNVVRNRLTRTICNYQEYGVNTEENQFLKMVLVFVSSYLNQKTPYFGSYQRTELQHILNYCRPAFEGVDEIEIEDAYRSIYVRKNALYPEYEESVRIGRFILHRFSFNISKATEKKVMTPPFWIDMSKLFELYVFGCLRAAFPAPSDVTYHDKFNKKETDILIKNLEYKCVVECKYKPYLADQSPSLDDKRQLAGYTRLRNVYGVLNITTSQVIKGLFIYPDQNTDTQINKQNLFTTSIGEYVDFFKLGIKLPQHIP